MQKLARISGMRRSDRLLDDELTNSHSSVEHDFMWPKIDYL